MKPCRSILMVGPDARALGGIRAVVECYRAGGLFERLGIVYAATHRDGSAWVKLRQALRGWLATAWRLATLDAPLVHVHVASRASFWRKSIVCLMARAAGRPYLYHLHGGGFEHFYERECGPLARRRVRSALSHAALVMTVSEDWRERILRICPSANVEALPNAVAVPASARLGRRSQPVRSILFLGQLGREKGVFDLVSAFARIAARFPDVTLVCAGHGDREPVETRARELGIAARVRCPGWLDEQAKAHELAAAGIYVLPSFKEGLPMALLEAMAWRLPVIATPVGGIPQVVTHDRNGLIVAPGAVEAIAAALERLLGDAALRERLGAAARGTIEQRFALESALRRLESIYARFGITARERSSVLFLLGSLAIGGSEAKTVRLANALAERGLDVTLAYLNPPTTLAATVSSRVTVVHLERRGKLSPHALRRLLEAVRARRIDTLVAVNLYPALYARLAQRRLGDARLRFIACVNTTDIPARTLALKMRLYRRVLRRADLVVFGAESQRRLWGERYGVGTRGTARVLYNGVDADRFRPQPAEPRDRLVIGTVGQMRPEKAHVHLVRALAALREKGLDVQALIVGDGAERGRIEAQIERLRLAPYVELAGEARDVRPYLARMDVFVLTSTAIETFSNAALEAMACGLPVVCAEIGGMAELIGHGGGVSYPPGDIAALVERLEPLLRDPDARRRMAEAARRAVVEHFSSSGMVERFAALLAPQTAASAPRSDSASACAAPGVLASSSQD